MLFLSVISTVRAKQFFANSALVWFSLGKVRKVCYLIYETIEKIFPLTVVATTIGDLDYLLQLHQQEPHEELPEKTYYLIGYHKRDPQEFFQRMTTGERQAFLQGLKLEYRQILINYFTEDKKLKQKIDQFIDKLFSANIPVPQVIQIHMEIIDDFSKQLRLEGRSDEVLLDYRLTLIDILAHLCEVYRSAIEE
ncbi:MAG: KaiA family protein [Nostocaceae cyanobacterium]|nr:KaiA family protein [Nostocaceae cyanobacterium]